MSKKKYKKILQNESQNLQNWNFAKICIRPSSKIAPASFQKRRFSELKRFRAWADKRSLNLLYDYGKKLLSKVFNEVT